MKHISHALLEALDLPQFRQPTAEQPHCVHRQQDMHEGMDDMGRYASESLAPARTHLSGEQA